MSEPNRVRVRVAPSPTGDPHVGTAYMALFNLAFARRQGGDFLLRIEDTDRGRYDADSERRILEALEWLGLDHDEGPTRGGPHAPYRQSERLPIYAEHARQLVQRGLAYPCFCTRERLDELRAEQKARKLDLGYDRHCRGIPAAAAAARVGAGAAHVVRLAMPETGKTGWQDLVRGWIEFENSGIDDQVLMKADGFPTYHLANIVDDHLMSISHVIRGEEWISSTPKHIVLYESFGWPVPVFAHMPLLRRPGGAKISKRKDPTNILWFRDQGYLPEALRNFLGNMGFSLSGDREIYTLEEMCSEFDFSRVKPRGPEFDLAKLDWMNGEYLRALPAEELVARATAFLADTRAAVARLAPPTQREWDAARTEAERARLEDEAGRRARLRQVAHVAGLHTIRPGVLPAAEPIIRERLHTWADLGALLHFFYEDLDYDPADLVGKKSTPGQTHEALTRARELYASVPAGEWSAAALETRGRELAGTMGIKPGDLFLALRVALTFARVSPPLFESMEILGPDVSLARIDRARLLVENA